MATVIDRLFVQGEAPGSPFKRSQADRRSLRQVPVETAKAVHVPRLQVSATPIAKRMEFLSKIREANFGLSSMDVPKLPQREGERSSNPSFVLNGKGVKDKSRHQIAPSNHLPQHSRAGRYKITPREIYRVSHGISQHSGGEHSPFGHGIHACFNQNLEELPRAIPRNVKSSKSQGEQLEYKSSASLPVGLVPPSTAPTLSNSKATCSESLRSSTMTSLELTGQKFTGYPNDSFYFYDDSILDDSCFPYLRSPKKRTRLSRSGFQNDFLHSDEELRSQDLHECLKINKTQVPGSRKSVTQPAVKESRGSRSDGIESVKKANQRYEFNTVESYLNFNRYNPSPNLKPSYTHIPRGMISLPAPWAESVLLNLIGDLPHPKSRLSSAKYSEAGFYGDKDEFFVIGSPTPFERQSLPGGKKSPGLGLKSHVSVKSIASSRGAEKIDEEDEEEVNLTKEKENVLPPTARSEVSSVDLKDVGAATETVPDNQASRSQREDDETEQVAKGDVISSSDIKNLSDTRADTSLTKDESGNQREDGDTETENIPKGDSASAPGNINEEARLSIIADEERAADMIGIS